VAENEDLGPNRVFQHLAQVCSEKNKAVDTVGCRRKKGRFGESLDFVEEGLYDVLWALVVAVRERLCHEFLVYGRDVRHVVAGR